MEDDVQARLKDVLYTAVGLGVLGFQRAQVARRELGRQLERALAEQAEPLGRLSRQIEETVAPALDRLEERLSEPGREAVRQARRSAIAARDALLARVSTRSGT